jgi:hypothetical protein
VAVAAVAGGFVLLFDSEAPVTPVAVIDRAAAARS